MAPLCVRAGCVMAPTTIGSGAPGNCSARSAELWAGGGGEPFGPGKAKPGNLTSSRLGPKTRRTLDLSSVKPISAPCSAAC
eukprot:4171225-Alexandrium_andersonii.AAC.1